VANPLRLNSASISRGHGASVFAALQAGQHGGAEAPHLHGVAQAVQVTPEGAAFTGSVRTVEFLGPRSLLRVDVGDALMVAFVPADAEVAPQQRIGLEPAEPGRACWFDAGTGMALS